MSQRTTQICGQEWSSFYESIKDFAKNPDCYKRWPRPPKYANRAATLHIGRNGFKMVDGVLMFANDVLPNIVTSFSFSQNWNEKVDKTIAQEVRIIPQGNCFVIELVYNPIKLQEVGSFCLLLYKYRKAGLRSQGKYSYLQTISNTRYNHVRDYRHKASSYVGIIASAIISAR